VVFAAYESAHETKVVSLSADFRGGARFAKQFAARPQYTSFMANCSVRGAAAEVTAPNASLRVD